MPNHTIPLRTGVLFDLSHTLARPWLEHSEYPWEILPDIPAIIREIGRTLDPARYHAPAEGVWIAKTAVVAPTASIAPPAIIGENTEVRHGAFIRGGALVGDDCVVGNSTELKNCILFDGVQVPHYNYVGDSILGHRAHMGAGAIASNLRSDRKNVVIHGDVDLPTGLYKVGAMLGDGAEIGCHAVLCPGAVVGRFAVVYPLARVRGVIPAHTIYKGSGVPVPKEEA